MTTRPSSRSVPTSDPVILGDMAGTPDWDDHDYRATAKDYARVRRADPQIADQVLDALGDARSVVNVGAGTGGYEPDDRYVVAVEPSADMRARRPAGAVPAVDADAAHLPFDDDSFDAALAVLTVHHWPDLEAGLAELRRVARGRVVVLTAAPARLGTLWLAECAPEFHATERRRYPAIERLAADLDGITEVRPLHIPLGCTDGFADAFYGRPEALLDPAVRQAQSAWSFVDEAAQAAFASRLRADLDSGAWDERHGHLRTQPTFDGSMRLVISA